MAKKDCCSQPRTRPRRSGTRPAKPDVQMTRSSSVGGAVFRGTCGYSPSKEDKNCSHLHLHVCTDCTAAAVLSMLLHSKLYRGSENNSNLRQLCFDLPRLKACSSYSLETVRRRPLEVATVTRTLKLTLKYLSEEVEIEIDKSSSIVRKPAQLVHFLDSMEN